MTTDMTTAILIEIVDMLQMINKTIIELSEDILRDDIPLAGLDAAESEANEVTHWAELYARTAKALQGERLHINELQERVHQLETQLFKSMI
jgi:hypothetical protein